ncbi:glycosyltransferase [Pseudomonas asiatica]|uniref:glycosyltransferase n=1 Tax=Pseudomonas asiatica TaxID=2219225 RepID=UPI00383AC041
MALRRCVKIRVLPFRLAVIGESMIRSLYSARPSPYYIIAPSYRRNSAGIRVMHMLCDALQRSGYEAYISTNGLNPTLMTPPLTDEVRARHKAQKIEPIVVYPEAAEGNPFMGNIVVRYLLNTPGFIGGDGIYGEHDVLFSYTKGLLLPGMPEDHVLFLPPIDLSIFRLPDDPSVRVPGKVCYYQGRSGKGEIDPALLPEDAVAITSRYPASWEELVELFQTSEYFISSTTTALSAEAVLCGCVGLVIPGPGAPVSFSSEETGNYGVAWGNTPEELERAKRTLPLLRTSLEQREAEFWPALDHFIEVTQQAAVDYADRQYKSSVKYWLEQRVPTAAQSRQIDQYLKNRDVPSIAVVILNSDGSTEKLIRTLNSLTRSGGVKSVFRTLVLTTPEVAAANPSDQILILDEADPVGAINRVVAGFTCDYFMIIQAGEEYTAGGLLTVVMDICSAPALRAAYADEVMRFEGGNLDFLMRPSLNLDLLLSLPVGMARHWLFHRNVWCEMGGFSTYAPEAYELEFILRLIEVGGFEGLGHISEPLVIGDALELHDNTQEREVIERHLRARGFAAAQVSHRPTGHYDLHYGHSRSPMVSIVLLLDGQLAPAQRCVESLLENTDYPNFEVLFLDRGNDEPQFVDWLAGIEQLDVGHLKVLRFPKDWPATRMRNQAASQACGEFLLFLDANTAAIKRDWLDELLNHGMRPEVGSVGGKLLGADGTIQGAGLLLGIGAPVTNPFQGVAADAAGYLRRLQVDQNYTALSEKCLLLRRELFMASGGFDEWLEPWGAVDLCIKLQQAGYLNVWTPRAQLLLGASEMAHVTPEQEDRLYQRWLAVLANDPASNPNFASARAGLFSVADSAVSWRPLATCQSVPSVLAHSGVGDSGKHRIIQPFTAMREEGLIEGALPGALLSVVELERFKPDVIVLQRQAGDGVLEAMRRMKAFSGAFKVFDLDECLLKPSTHSPSPDDALERLSKELGYMDRLLVPNEFMAQLFAGRADDVRIVQSRLDPRSWRALLSKRRCDDKPRVGWVGSPAEVAELEAFAEVIKALAGEVNWVMLGACPKHLRPFVHEYHQAVGVDAYPAKLASLNLDLAVVPREDNLFNRCKSDVRLLELGACGFPVICSDIDTICRGLPVQKVANRFEAWVDAIRSHIHDLDTAAVQGQRLQAQIWRERMLNGAALASLRDTWLER